MAETQCEVSQTQGAAVQDADTCSQKTEDASSADPEHYRSLMDSLYQAAANGNIEAFRQYENCLDKLLTPYGNSIVHINIAARSLPDRKKQFQIIESIMDDSSKSKSDDSSVAFLEWVKSKCPDLLRKPNMNLETPLHIAARHGHTDIVALLLENCWQDLESGVRTETVLTIRNIEGDTPIHEAVRYGHFHTVILMLLFSESKLSSYNGTTNPPPMNSDEETPLFLENSDGESLLYLAAEKGFLEIVAAILAFPSSQPHHGPNGRTALHAALIRNDIGITKILLENKKPMAEEKDEQGRIPLHYAASYGYTDIVKELLSSDKSLAYKTTSTGDQTALHLAASRGNASVVEELISKSPGCAELVDERGWNVLHFAVSSENEATVKYILSNPWLKNLINQKNKDGETTLHLLAASGTFLSSLKISWPKVDKLAFNNKHLATALDIISTKDDLWGPQEAKMKHRRRFVHNNNKIEVKQGHEMDKKVTESNADAVDMDQASINNWVIKEGTRIIAPGQEGFKVKSDGKKERNKAEMIIAGSDTKKGKDIMDYIKDAREAHLVVATLIATVVFAAGFTMPGGYKEEGAPDEGAPILTRRRAFQVFIIADTVAMMLSCFAVFIHFFMALEKDTAIVYSLFKLAKKSTISAMLAMMVAFITGMYAVLVHSSALAISACVLCSLFFLICWMIPRDWRDLPDKIGKQYSLSFSGADKKNVLERVQSDIAKMKKSFHVTDKKSVLERRQPDLQKRKFLLTPGLFNPIVRCAI